MTRTQKGLAIAGAIVLAFAVGFGWQYVRAERLEDDLARADRELYTLRSETILGAATIAAHRGNHDVALQLTSDFFTRLQEGRATAPPAARDELNAILAQRDGVITVLSRADPESAELLTRLFLRYRVAVGGPDKALPLAVQPPAGEN